jgi:8-oxo-dGTP diphosphatase
MPDSSSVARATTRQLTCSVDVALFAPRGNELAMLLLPPSGARSRGKWTLPSDSLRADESLDSAAARIAKDALGSPPSFLDQSRTHGGARRMAGATQMVVAYFGLTHDTRTAKRGAAWAPLSTLPSLTPRVKEELEVALAMLRGQVDRLPIAFRLLPSTFTLSELQAVYELLLGRRLHKASFRRSLHGAALVEATDEWRSEGRGRPAQLFRYAPPRRRRQRHGVRFDLLG